jgi:hypothetical protein
MSAFPGAYRQIPLWGFILVPIFFILVVLFSDVRYNLSPAAYIGHGTAIASLVIGFIFLYGMQKYDLMDLNVPIVTRNLIYLKGVADKYDSSLNKYLVRYAENFLDFDPSDYSIYIFEKKLLAKITDPNLTISVHDSVKKLEEIYNQRISGTNLIAEPIWYLVFIIALLLTLIFPMDMSFHNRADSAIIIALIWLPVTTIYALYLSELASLENKIDNTIKILKVPSKASK